MWDIKGYVHHTWKAKEKLIPLQEEKTSNLNAERRFKNNLREDG